MIGGNGLGQYGQNLATRAATDPNAAEEYKRMYGTPAPGAASKSPLPAKAPTPAYINGPRSIDAQVQYDAQGRPVRNAYIGMTDQQGNLLSQYSMAGKIGPDVQLNNQALNAMRTRALSTGPSAWAQMATQNQQLEQQNAMNAANRNALAQQNRQYGMMAARGGLSPAARERMAMQSVRGAFGATQNIANQGMQQRFNIGMEDEKQKLGLLQQLPGMDMNAATFDQSQRAYRNTAMNADIANAMKDVQGFNAYNADAYTEAMKAWAADKTANAMRG